jgi:YedE family putative selenium metabolism protein
MAVIRTAWQRFSGSNGLIISAGLITGALAALMTNLGNPALRGLSVTCFIRDITGALGLHQSASAQYIRPEIAAFILGAFITAYAFGEFRPRGGSSPILRFFLGFFVIVGAEVFLACPTQLFIRLAGGDLNGITGLAGLVSGIFVGVIFLRNRFNLGRKNQMSILSGWTMPVFMLGLLLLLFLKPSFIFFSSTGAGSHHAAIYISIIVGLVVGFLAQRTRMCFMGAWRDIFLIKNFNLFSGIAAFFIAALVTNYAVGNFHSIYFWSFTYQPNAHDNHLWNYLSMALVGLASVFLGGCPLRQTILSGEGDSDAGFAVLGMFAGAPITQNFLIVSSSEGVNTYGPVAVVIGLVFCIAIGFIMRERNPI